MTRLIHFFAAAFTTAVLMGLGLFIKQSIDMYGLLAVMFVVVPVIAGICYAIFEE